MFTVSIRYRYVADRYSMDKDTWQERLYCTVNSFFYKRMNICLSTFSHFNLLSQHLISFFIYIYPRFLNIILNPFYTVTLHHPDFIKNFPFTSKNPLMKMFLLLSQFMWTFLKCNTPNHQRTNIFCNFWIAACYLKQILQP